MPEDPDQVPLPGKFLGGVTVSEAIGLQGEARAFEGDIVDDVEDDELRLDVERFDEEPRRPLLRPPSRTAVITLWTVGLIAALAIAAYIQVSQQKRAAVAMDAAPPPAAAAPATLTTPIPPEPAPPAAAPIVVAEPKQALLPAPPASAPQPEAPAPAAKAPAPAPPAVAPKVAELPKTQKAAAAAQKPAAGRKSDVAHLRVQLNHAYNQAVKAGVPRSVLKARRAEWNVLYAKAQKKSPEAVAQLYRTRATELDALTKRQHAARRKTN